MPEAKKQAMKIDGVSVMELASQSSNRVTTDATKFQATFAEAAAEATNDETLTMNHDG